MPEYAAIQRVHDEASAIARQNAEMRNVIAKCRNVLLARGPDTFLGRKTQEPFPRGDDTTGSE